MLRAFDNCTPKCDFKHLIFLFSYKDKKLDKNWVLGCRFFSDFSVYLSVRETGGARGFWSGEKIWTIAPRSKIIPQRG